MMPHRSPYYLDGRLFEWSFSFASLILGVAMVVWPEMMQGSIVQVLMDLIGWPLVAAVFTLVGLCSMMALIANGQSLKIGPRVRSISAIFRAVLWGSFAISMLHVSFHQGFPSPMLFFFPVFTASELYVVYRAVLDVRDDN